MRHRSALALACAALAVLGWSSAAQQTAQFPLAAQAGGDGGAVRRPPAGAVNQGRFDESTWKYGPAFNGPQGSKVWNPAKIKLMQGAKLVGGTVLGVSDPQVYCAMANGGYD